MLAAAHDTINGGGNFDQAGYGGVDAIDARDSTTWWWWSGDNASWDWYTNNDGTPNDGKLVVNIDVTAGSYNAVAISWLTSGTYTYNHRTDAHPIGADFDVRVVNAGGTGIAGSFSYDNPHEFASFMGPSTDTYRVEITRFANRDTSAPLHLGLVHKFW